LAVGLTDHAIGDPHTVHPAHETSPLVADVHLRHRQLHPELLKRDERVGLEPGLTPRVDKAQCRNRSRPAPPSSLRVDHAPNVPDGCRAGTNSRVGHGHATSGTHRPETVGDDPVRCEDSEIAQLDQLIEDRIAMVQNSIGDPTRPRSDRERRQVHWHVGVQHHGPAHGQSGALMAQRVTRVSEKGAPTPRKVFKLEDLPPLPHTLGTGVLPVDTSLHVDQLPTAHEPGQDAARDTARHRLGRGEGRRQANQGWGHVIHLMTVRGSAARQQRAGATCQGRMHPANPCGQHVCVSTGHRTGTVSGG